MGDKVSSLKLSDLITGGSSPQTDPYAGVGVAAPDKADPYAGVGVPRGPSVGEGTMSSVAHGLTFGYGDEIKAAIHALMPGAIDVMNAPDPLSGDIPKVTSHKPTFGERYDEELAKTRQTAKDFATEHPVLSAGGNIAGSIAGLMGAAKAVPAAVAAPFVGRVANPVLRTARNALVGGGIGAGIGFGEGEGEGRLGTAVAGGLTGAALGGASVPAAGIAGKIAESPAGDWVGRNVIAPTLRGVNSLVGGKTTGKTLSAAAPDDGARAAPGFLESAADRAANPQQEGAINRLATAVERSGKPASYWQAQMEKYGPEAVIADLDPQFLSMAQGAKTLQGDTRTIAENVLKGRDKGTSQRIVSAAEGNQPPPSNYQIAGEGQALDQNLRAVGQKAYGAMDKAGLKQSPELMAIYENPHVSAAIDNVMKAEKSTRIGTDTPAASPVEIMHKVKQAIWDLGFDKETARPGPNASFYRDLGTKFMDTLKNANPELKAADKAYSDAAKLSDYYAAGKGIFARGLGEKATASESPALADLGNNASPQAQATMRAGSVNAIRDKTLTLTGARGLARDIEYSPELQARLTQVHGPEEAARIIKQAEAEGVFADTSNRLRFGSKTAESLSDAADSGNLAVRATTSGGIRGQAMEHLGDAYNWFVSPNIGVRNQIGRMTLNPDASENARYLARAGEILAKRRTNSLAPGAGGVAGGARSRE